MINSPTESVQPAEAEERRRVRRNACLASFAGAFCLPMLATSATTMKSPLQAFVFPAFLFMGGGLLGILFVLFRSPFGHAELLDLRPPKTNEKKTKQLVISWVILAQIAAFILAGLSTVALKLVGHPPPPHPILTLVKNSDSLFLWPAIILTVVAAAPLVEEMQYRVLLPSAFRSLGLPSPVILSSLCFALIHLRPDHLLSLFVFALILSRLRQRCQSLWPAIAAHSLFNAISLLFLYWET